MSVLTTARGDWPRRFGPEVALGVLAATVFLSSLGTVELWGKREQRAAAEAVDTVDHGRWLVAHIQGRPRLEKPPLPRWTIAALMTLTGRRDEAVVRLPGALLGLATVGLVYGLGRRLGGRSVGLASGLALTSMAFFVIESRQAGNDGPLAFFTTLAVYAAWRRLHGGPAPDDAEAPAVSGRGLDIEPAGARGWSFLFYGALGLGFLSKGPIAVVLAAVALGPYLALAGRLRAGGHRLADGWGLLLFLLLAACWPVPVLLADPHAWQVWMLEMGQKTGLANLPKRSERAALAREWPGMVLPWILPAALAAVRPFRSRGRIDRPAIWLPWSWAFGNLALFCGWSVAKPNYYLPCLPAVAILVGLETVRLARAARDPRVPWLAARGVWQASWVGLFVAAVVAAAVAPRVAPGLEAPILACALAAAAAVPASAWAWRRGADAGVLVPLVAAWAVVVVVGYGALAPAWNAARGHRGLAEALDRVLPGDAPTVMFFHELDEGLWFYLPCRTLAPVPGSQPRYNEAVDLVDDLRSHRLLFDARARLAQQEKVLLDWLADPARGSSYVLLRSKVYDLFAADLAGRAAPVLREHDLGRNELVLLRAADPVSAVGPLDAVAAGSDPAPGARR